MADSKKHVYDESKIKTLSSLEHIRLRTGMYIGRIGDGSHYDDGCYILLKEVIDNTIDEFIMGYGKEVQITIEGSTVTVQIGSTFFMAMQFQLDYTQKGTRGTGSLDLPARRKIR